MPKTISEKKKGATDIVSLRLGDDLLERIGQIQTAIQVSRGPGAKEVSRTEAIQILVELGLQNFKPPTS